MQLIDPLMIVIRTAAFFIIETAILFRNYCSISIIKPILLRPRTKVQSMVAEAASSEEEGKLSSNSLNDLVLHWLSSATPMYVYYETATQSHT